MSPTPDLPTRRRHVLVQATIPPLDEDGILAFSVGTVVFAILSVVAWAQLDVLRAQDRGWWFPTALAGFGIGVLAVAYCIWRRRPRRT